MNINFSLIIPVYNEEKNISLLLKELIKELSIFSNYEIICVDDCSNDLSYREITKFVNNKNIKCLKLNERKGQSFAIHSGIKTAKFNNIVTFDADLQNDPSDIKKLLTHFKDNSNIKLIGGIRRKREDNKAKIISSIIANFIRSKLLNDDCKDTGCSLKVFDKSIFLEFPFFHGIHRFLPALFKGYGHQTFFIDVNHRKRIAGVSKYGNFNRALKGIFDIIKVILILKSINKKNV